MKERKEEGCGKVDEGSEYICGSGVARERGERDGDFVRTGGSREIAFFPRL